MKLLKMSGAPHIISLSKHVQHLDGDLKERYIAKYSIIGVQDPYNLPPNMFTPINNCLPSNTPDFANAYHDLYNYRVNSQSYFTGKALKAYKNLEAYNSGQDGSGQFYLNTLLSLQDFFLSLFHQSIDFSFI